MIALSLSIIVAKISHPTTHVPSCFLGLVGPTEFASWGIVALLLYQEELIFEKIFYTLLIISTGFNFLLNLVQIIAIKKTLYNDMIFL